MSKNGATPAPLTESEQRAYDAYVAHRDECALCPTKRSICAVGSNLHVDACDAQRVAAGKNMDAFAVAERMWRLHVSGCGSCDEGLMRCSAGQDLARERSLSMQGETPWGDHADLPASQAQAAPRRELAAFAGTLRPPSESAPTFS